MLNSFPVSVLVGILLGALAGLGVGGGSLLILWLTIILNTPVDIAKGINLLFFLPAALVSCLFRHRQGRLSLQNVLPAMIAGALSAFLFTRLSTQISADALKAPFGFLLLITGIREIFYRPRKPR